MLYKTASILYCTHTERTKITVQFLDEVGPKEDKVGQFQETVSECRKGMGLAL